jgi:hypothetical protein
MAIMASASRITRTCSSVFWPRQRSERGREVREGAVRPPGPQNKESIMAARILMVFSASIVLTLGVLHLVSTFWGPSLTPRYDERNNHVAVLGGLQCQPQPGTYFVRLGFRLSRIRSRPTPLSVTVPARCRAGNAWWFGCALQGLFFQLASQRRQHFFCLLCGQHCAIAGLTMRS